MEVAPLAYIQSVQVQVLDEEHEVCEAALQALQESPTVENAKAVLQVYSDHFAHEEALLDEHMWPVAASGKSAGGFDADANARKSHFVRAFYFFFLFFFWGGGYKISATWTGGGAPYQHSFSCEVALFYQ